MSVVGITRVRNEALIIEDTIRHYLGRCDFIILYDDCSVDETADIAREVGGHRISVIEGNRWITDRVAEETRHRKLLVDTTLELFGPDAWCLCFDADERLVGPLPQLTGSGWRFRLFDGYLTERCSVEYSSGPLEYLPRLWGPEYRDILILFKAASANFVGLDQRAPRFVGHAPVAPHLFVKHFGKCLSVDHWEETCDYYAKYFPARYRQKWLDRKGKAIHTVSDFGRPLFEWTDLMESKNRWVQI